MVSGQFLVRPLDLASRGPAPRQTFLRSSLCVYREFYTCPFLFSEGHQAPWVRASFPGLHVAIMNSLKTLSSNTVTLGGSLQHLDLGEERSVADGEPRKRGRA